MLLLIDNFDSFTYNLVDYFGQLGLTCDVRRNDEEVDQYIGNKYQGVVLSPGPEQPKSAGNLLKVIDQYVKKTPVLGICLGHQAIGEYYDANIVRASKPMHGKQCEIHCTAHNMYEGLPTYHKVVRYNSLLIEEVKSPLLVTATSSSGEVMAIAHETLPVWGVQYHPEAVMSEHGLATLNNWAKLLV